MSDLRVDVNLLWLTAGRVGGSEQYLTRQLSGLRFDSGIAARLMCPASFTAAYPQLAARFETAVAPFARDWRGGRMLAEHTWLTFKDLRADVVHHGGGTAPLYGKRPIVLTVHDLQYRTFPDHFSPLRLRYLQAMMPRSVRRAAVITTPSEYVRQTVIEAFGVAAERVVVVPHGVPESAIPSTDEIELARRRFGLESSRYVVYPAITHPHKRHDILIEMIAHLDPEMSLVLLGGEGTAEPLLRRRIENAGVWRRVVRPGRVDEPTRDALIAGAEALVFPSDYEGFGAPLVEAMMLGTPVVRGVAHAVDEVVGDAGVTVTSSTGEAWAAGVEEAVRDSARLVAAGHARRRRFTPEISGERLAAAYRQAGGRT